MDNRKKDQIQNLIMMITIGVITGGGISIVASMPILFSTAVITTICGTISIAQSGLIADTIKKISKTNKKDVKLPPVVEEHISDKLKVLSQEKVNGYKGQYLFKKDNSGFKTETIDEATDERILYARCGNGNPENWDQELVDKVYDMMDESKEEQGPVKKLVPNKK